MTDQITTRTCPDCRTIFRHRGQDRCPNCGHRFDAVRSEPSTETRDVPPLPPDERPAPTPPLPPPPPPAPEPVTSEPVYEPTDSPSELDSLLLPYASNTVRRTEPPELPPPPPPPPPVVYEETPPPVPIPEPTAHTRSMDPVDEALAGEHLVPADTRLKKRHSRMPWYLRRETLIGLALVAVVLIAVIVQLSS